jgi:N-acetylmuramoyl-L-alanine amidase
MTPMEFFSSLTDIELLARLIYGEARGEPVMGQAAVAFVAINRAALPGWWGETLKKVILKPFQFSCFLSAYNGSIITPLEEEWASCILTAHDVLSGDMSDFSNGATHYYADTIDPPYWAASMTVTNKIGKHTFLR